MLRKGGNKNIMDMKNMAFHFPQTPLARYMMMSTLEDKTTFHFLAPAKGIYLLDVFAAPYPTMDSCTKKEATKYINVCRFKIDCPTLDMVSFYYF